MAVQSNLNLLLYVQLFIFCFKVVAKTKGLYRDTILSSIPEEVEIFYKSFWYFISVCLNIFGWINEKNWVWVWQRSLSVWPDCQFLKFLAKQFESLKMSRSIYRFVCPFMLVSFVGTNRNIDLQSLIFDANRKGLHGHTLQAQENNWY